MVATALTCRPNPRRKTASPSALMTASDDSPSPNSPAPQSDETVPEARPFRAAFPLERGSGELRELLVPSEAVARSLPRVVPGRSDVTEPILVPKLRIHLADFPYLHSARPRGCSPWRPDAEFGTHRHGSLAPFARVFMVRPPPERPRRIHGALAFSRRARVPASARSDSWDRWGVSQNR